MSEDQAAEPSSVLQRAEAQWAERECAAREALVAEHTATLTKVLHEATERERQLHEAAEQHAQSLAEAQKQIQALTAQVDGLRAQLEQAQRTASKQAQTETQLRAEYQQLQSQLSQQVEAAKEARPRALPHIRPHSTKAELARQSTTSETLQSQKDLEAAKRKLEEASSSLTATKQSLAAERKQREGLAKQNEQLRADLEQRVRPVPGPTPREVELQQSLDRAQAELSHTAKAWERLRADLTQRVQELERQCDQLRTDKDSVQTQLDAAQQRARALSEADDGGAAPKEARQKPKLPTLEKLMHQKVFLLDELAHLEKHHQGRAKKGRFMFAPATSESVDAEVCGLARQARQAYLDRPRQPGEPVAYWRRDLEKLDPDSEEKVREEQIAEIEELKVLIQKLSGTSRK